MSHAGVKNGRSTNNATAAATKSEDAVLENEPSFEEFARLVKEVMGVFEFISPLILVEIS